MGPFQHIKDTVCPVCGSRMISESRDHQHTNGNWNERRGFDCGLRLHYSPNMGRVALESRYGHHDEDTQFDSMCRKDPRLLAYKAKVNEEIPKLRVLLDGADLSPGLRTRVEVALTEHERWGR
jgi:hypothetical protein